MRALALLAVLVMAGCASPPRAGDPGIPAEPPLDLPTLAYTCPPRGQAPPGGLCLASVGTGANEAPVLRQAAVHPSQPQTWAVLGDNVVPPPDATEAERQLLRPGADRVRSFLYATEDAGQTWVARYLPVVPFWSSATSQVVRESSTTAYSMVWDAAGTLHVAGSVENELEESMCECPSQGITTERHAFHITTTDLGRSWGAATDLGRFHGTLEVRLALAGPRLVAAFGSDDGAQVHVSSDAGATWVAVDGHPKCPIEPPLGDATDTRLTSVGDVVYFRCRGQGASFYYRLDPHGLEIVKLDGPDEDVEGPRTPCTGVLLRQWRGRPAFVGGGCPGVLLWLQNATGAWQPPLELAVAEAPDGFESRTVTLLGADVQGDVVHVLLDINDDARSSTPLPEGRRTLVHVAAAVDGTRLLEAGADLPHFVTDVQADQLVPASVSDPFAFQGGRGLLVVPVGNGFAYTLVESTKAAKDDL